MPTPIHNVARAVIVLALGALVCGLSLDAQTYADELNAVSVNVSEPGQRVVIRILQWSTPDDSERLIAALNPPPPEPEPELDAPAGRGGRGRGGRGRGAFGGRGGRGGEPADPVLAALDESPTVGYIWTDQVAGYAIKYAWRESLPGGGERIVLATNRRLGVHTTAWEPVDTEDDFTLIELRLDGNGAGEGKTSLNTDIVVDETAGTPALGNYAGTRVVLQNVRR